MSGLSRTAAVRVTKMLREVRTAVSRAAPQHSRLRPMAGQGRSNRVPIGRPFGWRAFESARTNAEQADKLAFGHQRPDESQIAAESLLGIMRGRP